MLPSISKITRPTKKMLATQKGNMVSSECVVTELQESALLDERSGSLPQVCNTLSQSKDLTNEDCKLKLVFIFRICFSFTEIR